MLRDILNAPNPDCGFIVLWASVLSFRYAIVGFRYAYLVMKRRPINWNDKRLCSFPFSAGSEPFRPLIPLEGYGM